MDFTTNAAFVLFAAVSPLLIAFVKQAGFSDQRNSIIAFGCYIVVGILGAVMSGTSLTIDHATVLVTIATVVGSAAYNLIWNNLGTGTAGTSPSLDAKLTAATSFVKAP